VEPTGCPSFARRFLELLVLCFTSKLAFSAGGSPLSLGYIARNMTLQDVINAHQQIFQKSCPSSVMELVLKLHGKITDLAATPIQTKYGNENVGFTKLYELTDIGGLIPTKHDMSFTDAWTLCTAENKAGRFPLVSLPTESRKSFFDGSERIADDSHHVFITVLNPTLTLVCHAFPPSGPMLFPAISEIQRRILDFDSKKRVDLVSYML